MIPPAPPRCRAKSTDRTGRGFSVAVLVLGAVLLAGFAGADRAAADDPVALRIESLPVVPAHFPSAVVVVVNHGEKPFQGTLRLEPPEGWSLSHGEEAIALAPGEKKRVAFMVKRGMTRESNRYPFEASVTGPGVKVTHRQEVVAASAPYFKPTIDGATEEWKDAIPITWTTDGRKTVTSTYWNRRRFSLLVAVGEEELIPLPEEPGAACDAVQLAMSPEDATTLATPQAEAARFEFLFVATGQGTEGKCFLLAEPGTGLAETQQVRALGPREYDDAEVAVRRSGGVTYYECSIPFRPMRRAIRPSEGREFCLSVLVHDPDGTGIRDWGRAAGLGPCQRNRLAWSLWPGAAWGDRPPLDNKTKWGLCSSKY